MERKMKHPVPICATVSRKTGQVTEIQWIENATAEEFQNMVDWMLAAGRAAKRAAESRMDRDAKAARAAADARRYDVTTERK